MPVALVAAFAASLSTVPWMPRPGYTSMAARKPFSLGSTENSLMPRGRRVTCSASPPAGSMCQIWLLPPRVDRK